MALREIVFFSVVLVLVVVLHAYVGRRLVGTSALGPRWRGLAWGILVAGAVAMLFAFLGGRFLGGAPWFRAAQWTGFTAMGFLAVLFPLVALRDAVLGAFRGARRLFSRARPEEGAAGDPSRRGFLLRASSGVVLGAGALIGLGSLAQARRRPAVKRVTVPIDGLPPGLAGLRIAQITDLHLGPTLGRAFLEDVVETVNGLDADLVAVTGDLVDGRVADLRPCVEPLALLRARHGAFFVTGNHEYYWDAEAWIAEVRRLGLTVLRNEHRVLEHGGAMLLVAGVTDVSAGAFLPSHRSDPRGALAGAPPVGAKLLLAHQPRSLPAARAAGFDLQLSGHTHGGQFFPWNLLIHLVQPVVAGLERFGDTWIYVSRGTGQWGPPMRSGAPAEITLVELARGSR